MGLDITTLFNSAIMSAINGVAIYLSVRYAGRLFERLDSNKTKNPGPKKFSNSTKKPRNARTKAKQPLPDETTTRKEKHDII